MRHTLYAFALTATLLLSIEAIAGDRDKSPIVLLENDGVSESAAEADTMPLIIPSATYMFAERDTCLLYLDIYEPAAVSRGKPTIIFVFGGGFISGHRDSQHYLPWFKSMTDMGFRIVSIDYRLGLKGISSAGAGQTNALDNAIHIAVEDLYSATAFLIENAETLGIDPDNIVVSGSSAGAITSLQAEYEICNMSSRSSILPDGFNYAGVMSFSGGIFSRRGKLKFDKDPCPLLLLYGTKDKVVNYKQIKAFNIGFFGSDKIAQRLDKFGCTYKIVRCAGNGGDIADIMKNTALDQTVFIEENVMR
ncbi:MAG: carboxylesterase family protein [Bacteroidales bacterium]|nr:carboxylesterase family protein [Bacteroidales bacterium]